MASTKVIMPQMGESVAEGTVAKWLKQVGDKVERDENILEISTDKIDAEVPAPVSGYLREILVEEGETVEVKTAIAIVSDSMDDPVEDAKPAKAQVEGAEEEEPEKKTEEKPAEPKEEKKPETAKKTEKKPITAGEERGSGDKRKFFTPVVLRMAQEHDIDLDEVEGTGMGGRVTKKDVQRYLEEGPKKPAEKKETQKKAAPSVSAADYGEDRVEVIDMSNVRKRTAEHMIRSKQTSAHVHTMQEVDMTNIVRYRESVKDQFKKENGFPLSYMSIVTKEVCEAIREFPMVNSSVDTEKNQIIVKKFINIGMAVALPDETLIVPVIKNADHLNVVGLSKAIYDLAMRARNKKLTMDDIQDGTFSITNHGVFGSVFGTPIISQPQVAILGTGAMRKRPVIKEDEEGNEYIAIRTMMYLTLGYDHRIIDGGYGGKFCSAIAERLEYWTPERM
jgi:2-oxoglutarate dehydrogenase dihydrolipoamide succinyltransferase (E2 component)